MECLPEIADDAGTVEDFESLLCHAELAGTEDLSLVSFMEVRARSLAAPGFCALTHQCDSLSPIARPQDNNKMVKEGEWVEFLDKASGEKVCCKAAARARQHARFNSYGFCIILQGCPVRADLEKAPSFLQETPGLFSLKPSLACRTLPQVRL